MEEALITVRRDLLHKGPGKAVYDFVPFISYQIFSSCAVIYSFLYDNVLKNELFSSLTTLLPCVYGMFKTNTLRMITTNLFDSIQQVKTSIPTTPSHSIAIHCLNQSSTANIIMTTHTFRTPTIWKSHKLSHCHQRRICLSCRKRSGLELFSNSRFQTFSVHNQFILNVVHRGIKM